MQAFTFDSSLSGGAVDREGGVIRRTRLITGGITARGHDPTMDDTTIATAFIPTRARIPPLAGEVVSSPPQPKEVSVSPAAGELLTNEIAPRIYGTVPHSAAPSAPRMPGEVAQDTVAMAARLLDRNEATGRPMFPSSIAYYSIQHAKSGRRFITGAGASDVMSPRTQLEGHISVSSFDDPVAFDEFTGEPLTLTEMISGDKEDPSTVAARSIDWETFLATQSGRGRKVVQLLAKGPNALQIARKMKLAPWQVYGERDKVAKALREHMGQKRRSTTPPLWHSNLNASRERLACRERHRGV